MKTKKRKKNTRMHGKKMGTHGWGARKKHKKSGHSGGSGLSGTGKRADHKKTLMTKLYGGGYFGKQGITSRGTKKDKSDRINLREIEANLGRFVRNLKKDKIEINLINHKILGTGEVKHKLFIKAKAASKSAIEKVKKAGGEIILPTLKEPVEIVEKKKNKKESGENIEKE
jgi:large subunit ribosomal protein L15